MKDGNDPEHIASFLQCLSLLEYDTYRLFKKMSEIAEFPLIKSLLFSIAADSEKHASLLKGVAESIAKPKHAPKDCEKLVGEAWRTIGNLNRELEANENANEEDLPKLAERLATLESVVGEEYNVFVQLKTLKLMAQQIKQLYNVNVDQLKEVFEGIIADEEHHREVIATIQELLRQRTEEQQTTDPLENYRDILRSGKQ